MDQTTTQHTAGAVRAEMARRRVSIRELGLALGWSRNTTSRRVNGIYPFDVDELMAVAAFLGIPVTDLLPAERVA